MFVRACLVLAVLTATAFAQKEFGFDNRKASGQPYLTPEESVRRMKVADGFEVKLFAAEPMVVNPVAMTIDERGRLWVVECFEYPNRTPPGKMPRDRIVILEDTKGTGVADKRTVFCEGKDFPERFDLATAIEVGNGGVYVGAAPYVWFIENKNDKPGKFEKLLTGFGSQDTHETLNTFQWGPDGWLYGLHGIYTQSKVATGEPAAQARDKGKEPLAGAAGSPPTELNAGVWRYHPTRRKFEVFAEGTSNPWGWDYRNTDGQIILACCVIPHLFHIVPGGVYKRQSGQSNNPYAYGYINEICDHTFHKESGWAHAGLLSLDTSLMPPEYRDSVIFGSIHGCSLKRNVLKKNGSTFTASRADDFLVSGDKNFRPINLRWGPNGEIFVIDWHDQNPCHQAANDSWDYEHGRVYRIQKKGATTKKAEDLGKKTLGELTTLANSDNPYHYRTALRLLAERPKADEPNTTQRSLPATVKAIWSAAAVDPGFGEWIANSHVDDFIQHAASPAIRVWLLRSAAKEIKPLGMQSLEHIAAYNRDPEVQVELANITRRIGGSLDNGSIQHNLMYLGDATDPTLPLMLWLAYEPRLAANPKAELEWMANVIPKPIITDHIVPRAMRRLVATGKADDLAACVAFAAGVADPVRLRALEGLVEALKGRQVDSPAGWADAQTKLLADPSEQVKKLAGTLAINFRDKAAIGKALAVAADKSQPSALRAEAIRMIAPVPMPDAKAALLKLAAEPGDVGVEAIRALALYDTKDVPAAMLRHWKNLSPAQKTEAVNLLASRKAWAGDLLAAVAAGKVEKTALSANAVLRLRAFKDKKIIADIEKVWGKFRDTPVELNKMIDDMRGQLSAGPASFAHGKLVFEAQCVKCHKFEGRGHSVGPELDGAGRDIEYILVNVLDPNRVVGQPYFIRRLTMQSGQIEEGLLAAEDPQTITLKGENDAQRVFARKDIEQVEIVERSMMPEGLGTAMSVQDFRDLVRYVMANPFVTAWDFGNAPVTGRLTLPGNATTEVTAPAAMKTRLLLGAAAPLRVTLNGKVVYNGTPAAGAVQPDQVTVDVELAKGVNKLAIEGRAGAAYVRFHDPDRKLTYPEAAALKK
jgi:putative membrane-bound dehydrogenase-like protein